MDVTTIDVVQYIVTEPDFVRYVERESIDTDKALRLLNELEDDGPMKPWTLISRVKEEAEDSDELRVNVLKPLTPKGYITPNADGDLYVDSRRDFRDDYDLH